MYCVSCIVMDLIIWTEKENYRCISKEMHCDNKRLKIKSLKEILLMQILYLVFRRCSDQKCGVLPLWARRVDRQHRSSFLRHLPQPGKGPTTLMHTQTHAQHFIAHRNGILLMKIMHLIFSLRLFWNQTPISIILFIKISRIFFCLKQGFSRKNLHSRLCFSWWLLSSCWRLWDRGAQHRWQHHPPHCGRG